MRRGAITLALFTLLVGLLSVARPATSQEPLPTPRGQLGGRPPLALTPFEPLPTRSATPVAGALGTPIAPASGTPRATPVPVGFHDGVVRAGAVDILPAVVAVDPSAKTTGTGLATEDAAARR